MPSLIEHIHGNKEGIDKIIQSFVDSYKTAEISKNQVKRMIMECAQKKRGEIPLVKTADAEAVNGNVLAPLNEPLLEIVTDVAYTREPVQLADKLVNSNADVQVAADATITESSTPLAPAPTCIYFGTSRWIVSPEYLDKYCSKLKVWMLAIYLVCYF